MTYEELVNKRKNYDLKIPGLINYGVGDYRTYDLGYYLDPWAKWHKTIPSDILLIGQDWGNLTYYSKNQGYDDDNNPTCRNLITLFEQLNIDIGKPNTPAKNLKIHFTNIIPFLRTGEMQGGLNKILNQDKINEFASDFIKPLIEITNPPIIITLGKASTIAVMAIFGQIVSKNKPFKNLVDGEPINLKDGVSLFPRYHCGASSINRNRNLEQQKKDWSKISAKTNVLNY
jgi:hypothetical protein